MSFLSPSLSPHQLGQSMNKSQGLLTSVTVLLRMIEPAYLQFLWLLLSRLQIVLVFPFLFSVRASFAFPVFLPLPKITDSSGVPRILRQRGRRRWRRTCRRCPRRWCRGGRGEARRGANTEALGEEGQTAARPRGGGAERSWGGQSGPGVSHEGGELCCLV